MPIYLPKFDNQLDPDDKYRGFNCLAAATSMAVDRHTLGGLVPGQRLIRSLTNEPIPDSGAEGLTIPQVVAAAKRLHIILADKSGAPISVMLSMLTAGCGVVLITKNGALPSAFRCSTFVGGHGIYINELKTRSDGVKYVTFANPLCVGWHTLRVSDQLARAFNAFPPPKWCHTRVTPRVAAS